MKIIENVLFGVYESDIINNTISIPDKVDIIHNLAFSGNKLLEKIDLSHIRIIGNGAFFGCTNLKLVKGSLNVSKIKSGAFWSCSSLKNFDISNNITEIENDTFRGCSSLESIDIPNSVTAIGDAAFFGCESLKNVNIKGNVETIGEAAFWHCKSLEKINIPDSIIEFGKDVFEGCNSIDAITLSIYQFLSSNEKIDKQLLEEIKSAIEPLKDKKSTDDFYSKKQKKIVIA